MSFCDFYVEDFFSLGEAEEQIRSFGLPAQKSSELIARFNDHAQASKGLHGTSKDAEELAIYNKILNFETALTLAQKSRVKHIMSWLRFLCA